MKRLTERRILWLILIAFVALGLLYGLITPVFEASDELWHYPMVRHLADGNSLPVQTFDPQEAGPWKQEASQPPLYYYLAAAATFWIDTSDMETVRWLNPHVDNGIITEDGNVNLVVHDPAADRWAGTHLAIRVTRVMSVLLGAVTVYLTYRIAKEAVPDRSDVALGAAAVNAFTPMFLFISGAVNNDNLVIPLASLSLLLMIQLVRNTSNSRWARIGRPLALGIVIGLGALTKITALGLLPLAAGVLFLCHWQRQGRPTTMAGVVRITGRWLPSLFLVVIPVLLIAGWWYVRNIQLYGDWSGWNAFIAVLGQRAHPASLAQLWDERWGFMLSYWGLFGGLNVPMPEWIYRLLNAVVLLSLPGFVLYVIQIVRSWRAETQDSWRDIGAIFYNLLALTIRHIGLVLCILWSLAVVVGLIRWATVTWSSQGRLVFSAISALSTLLVTGLIAWMPARTGRFVGGGLSLFLFAIAAVAPFLWIRPAYQPTDAPLEEGLRDINVDYDEKLRLLGYSLEPDELMPGETVAVVLRWQALAEIGRDWSIFVHLNDPAVNVPVAQRDMFPGQGLVATRLLSPGDTWTDRHVLRIPDTAVAPADLTLAVGLYDYQTGERLAAPGGLEVVELGQVTLNPRTGAAPNPLSVNFENELELVGFTAPKRRLAAGELLDFELYWRTFEDLETDYTLFAQIVGEDTTRWASQDLPISTSDWPPGDVQELSISMILDPDVPAGSYPLILGLYTRSEDGSFDRLQTVTAEGRLTDDFLVLTYIQVE